jgi:hypothetical protein
MRRLISGNRTVSSGLAVCAALALSLAVAACGSRQRAARRTTATESLPGINTSLPGSAERGTLITSRIPPGQRVRGDGDADNPGDGDGNGDVDPEDGDSDYPVPSSYRFPDPDDRETLAFGRAASPAQRGAVAAVLQRYYAAAAAGDGTLDCSLLIRALANSAAEDYAGAGSPTYMRGAKTCPAVLERTFRQSHQELVAPIEVYAVRVAGSKARAVVSSKTLRASMIGLAREGGSWRVQTLLGLPLP